MAGLVKAKKYDWKDSNLALFGSDTERQVKKESACCEPAWEGAGQEVGLQIWRIVKFQVTHWPKQDYGKFYGGDSYIILNTYKPKPLSEELAYDVHFWIGSESSQDEYGTAAYKTVELDTFLDDKAVQHREVMSHESDLFLSYFPAITVMKGGAATGFNHVTPEEYPKRLLHFCGSRRNISVKEVPLARSRLNSNDVFILDLGLTVFQWNGSGSNKDERFKAAQYLNDLKEDRRGRAEIEHVDESTDPSTHRFYTELDGEDEDDEDDVDEAAPAELFRASDASGFMEFVKLKDGDISPQDFDSNDVFMLDTGTEFFVWIGSKASPTEKKNGFGYAHKQLAKTAHPCIPVVVVKEGQTNSAFAAAVGAAA